MNYLKSLFTRDVNKVLAGLSKLVIELESLVETGKTDVENLAKQLENKKNDVALAEKAAANIKALFN